MNALLSRITHVFEIEDRGCAIEPGIPASSAVRVKTDDQIYVRRPDGTSISCQVRGIGIVNRANTKTSIPLLIDQRLSKKDLQIGSEIWIDAPIVAELTYHIQSAVLNDFSARFFQMDDNGHLRFGWSGITIHSASIDDLCRGAFECSDYIMEGFVSYLLTIESTETQINISIGLLGTNRDEYIRPQFDLFLKEAGLAFTLST